MTIDDDKFHDECGVFGVFNDPKASELTYLGLYALQHRGQESAGIVAQDHKQVSVVKGMGLVSAVFSTDQFDQLKGTSAIGHVRYSTTGASTIHNIQPLFSKTSKGKIALAHNGNLTNAFDLYASLKSSGAIFQSTSDSEVILHLMARSQTSTAIDALMESLSRVEGAYSLGILAENLCR